MDLMSERQWKRWDAVARVAAGKLTMTEAAQVLGLSVRQLRRIRRRVEQAGRNGLAHGNQGREPSNKLAATIRTRVLTAAADAVRRLQRPALRGEARDRAAGARALGAHRAPHSAPGGRRGHASAPAAAASAAARAQSAGGADAAVGRESARVAGRPRARRCA